jgi:hypothetical protein
MKMTGLFNSGQKLIINAWGPGKTGESDKLACVPGVLYERTVLALHFLSDSHPTATQGHPPEFENFEIGYV